MRAQIWIPLRRLPQSTSIYGMITNRYFKLFPAFLVVVQRHALIRRFLRLIESTLGKVVLLNVQELIQILHDLVIMLLLITIGSPLKRVAILRRHTHIRKLKFKGDAEVLQVAEVDRCEVGNIVCLTDEAVCYPYAWVFERIKFQNSEISDQNDDETGEKSALPCLISLRTVEMEANRASKHVNFGK